MPNHRFSYEKYWKWSRYFIICYVLREWNLWPIVLFSGIGLTVLSYLTEKPQTKPQNCVRFGSLQNRYAKLTSRKCNSDKTIKNHVLLCFKDRNEQYLEVLLLDSYSYLRWEKRMEVFWEVFKLFTESIFNHFQCYEIYTLSRSDGFNCIHTEIIV